VGEGASCILWGRQRGVICGRDSELCSVGETASFDLWERASCVLWETACCVVWERVVFCGRNSEL